MAKSWEYRVEQITLMKTGAGREWRSDKTSEQGGLEPILTTAGKEGWELVGIVLIPSAPQDTLNAFYKRPASN